ncbi:cellulose-binding protein [Streptomyces sp. NBC_00239]|uniref:cellulose-binding protein n=1 Tax=Streptomyces sp. NBC_00239 TaxID=2903640 RepID=UPI002E2A4D91|nr:cellulose-binding protein [Streptomyces sp. NBC_00239]
MSPQGFVTVRGRGYRPQEVDRRVAALSASRDEAWERAARLTVLAKRMEAEAAGLREAVAQLAPQTYDLLSERARRILGLAQEEAEELAFEARGDAAAALSAARARAERAAELAREDATAVREQTEVRSRQALLRAQGEADALRLAARQDAEEWRGQALAALREMGHRTDALLAEQEQEHVERWDGAEREYAARAAGLDARHAEMETSAQSRLAAAKRAYALAEEAARHGQEDAEARGAELIAQARVEEERIVRETDRVLREHAEEQEEMRAHMNHVRSSLAALTGRAAPAEG